MSDKSSRIFAVDAVKAIAKAMKEELKKNQTPLTPHQVGLKVTQAIADQIKDFKNSFEKMEGMSKSAPPEFSEEAMHDLKHKHGTDSAFKIAWAAHNKKKLEKAAVAPGADASDQTLGTPNPNQFVKADRKLDKDVDGKEFYRHKDSVLTKDKKSKDMSSDPTSGKIVKGKSLGKASEALDKVGIEGQSSGRSSDQSFKQTANSNALNTTAKMPGMAKIGIKPKGLAVKPALGAKKSGSALSNALNLSELSKDFAMLDKAAESLDKASKDGGKKGGGKKPPKDPTDDDKTKIKKPKKTTTKKPVEEKETPKADVPPASKKKTSKPTPKKENKEPAAEAPKAAPKAPKPAPKNTKAAPKAPKPAPKEAAAKPAQAPIQLTQDKVLQPKPVNPVPKGAPAAPVQAAAPQGIPKGAPSGVQPTAPVVSSGLPPGAPVAPPATRNPAVPVRAGASVAPQAPIQLTQDKVLQPKPVNPVPKGAPAAPQEADSKTGAVPQQAPAAKDIDPQVARTGIGDAVDKYKASLKHSPSGVPPGQATIGTGIPSKPVGPVQEDPDPNPQGPTRVAPANPDPAKSQVARTGLGDAISRYNASLKAGPSGKDPVRASVPPASSASARPVVNPRNWHTASPSQPPMNVQADTQENMLRAPGGQTHFDSIHGKYTMHHNPEDSSVHVEYTPHQKSGIFGKIFKGNKTQDIGLFANHQEATHHLNFHDASQSKGVLSNVTSGTGSQFNTDHGSYTTKHGADGSVDLHYKEHPNNSLLGKIFGNTTKKLGSFKSTGEAHSAMQGHHDAKGAKIIKSEACSECGHVAKKEVLHGGKGDHKEDSDFDSEELSEGIEHESSEHGEPSASEESSEESSKDVAKEIAKDHLSEKPDYYSELKELDKAFDFINKKAPDLWNPESENAPKPPEPKKVSGQSLMGAIKQAKDKLASGTGVTLGSKPPMLQPK